MRGMTSFFSAVPESSPVEVATVTAQVMARCGSDAGVVLAMLGIEA